MEIEQILAELREAVRGIQIRRLEKTDLAEDDFRWFITGNGLSGELQIESCEGNAPFRIEYDWAKRGWTVPEAADVAPLVQSLIEKRREKTSQPQD